MRVRTRSTGEPGDLLAHGPPHIHLALAQLEAGDGDDQERLLQPEQASLLFDRRGATGHAGRAASEITAASTARAFIAVTGTLDENGTMHAKGTHAGPLPLLKRIARLIAEDEQLAS